MTSRPIVRRLVLRLSAPLALSAVLAAQQAPAPANPAVRPPSSQTAGVDPATLLKPPADSWLTYHGDYTGRRNSSAHADHPRERAPADPGVGLEQRSGGAAQVIAHPRQRGAVPDGAGQHLGDRRAHGPSDLALHLSEQRGLPHRPPRRSGLQRLGLPDDAGRAPDCAGREGRQGQVERDGRRREEGLLVHERAAAHQGST